MMREETVYRLELLLETKMIQADQLNPLHAEANELIAIFLAIVTLIKKRRT